MKKALILHGIRGNPMLNWYQYVAKKAKEKGYAIYIPQLPSPSKPDWELTYQAVSKDFVFNPETVLIGHSSGASLALGILQKLPDIVTIKRTILICGFIDPNLTSELHTYIPRSDYDKLFPKKWDWEKIRRTSGDFVIFYSPSDPFVQPRHADTMKEKLTGKLVIIPDALHFSVTSGGERFREFPELVEYL